MCSAHIAYTDVRFFVHATEDLDKVIQAVHQVLPAEYREDLIFKKDTLRGHYGNPITLFEARMKAGDVAKALIGNIFSNLNEVDRKSLLEEIEMHVEEGSLYVRLDKQAAFQGEMKLCSSDPIRVRIRFRKKRIEDIVKVCQELGLSS